MTSYQILLSDMRDTYWNAAVTLLAMNDALGLNETLEMTRLRLELLDHFDAETLRERRVWVPQSRVERAELEDRIESGQ